MARAAARKCDPKYHRDSQREQSERGHAKQAVSLRVRDAAQRHAGLSARRGVACSAAKHRPPKTANAITARSSMGLGRLPALGGISTSGDQMNVIDGILIGDWCDIKGLTLAVSPP